MKYRNDRHGEPISILGYGCMRFTTSGGRIDMAKTEKELMEAYKAGVNYFDTAYVYPGSEAALGEILEKNRIRDKVNIATKLPQYLIGSRAAVDKYFDEELKRLRTDHVDYYLMHHMTAMNQWDKLKKVGIEDWFKEKEASGQIRNIGFSYHGNTEDFIGILNSYDWDFCQFQYNYIDEFTQAGRRGMEHAAAKGIPIVIMEPLRGGRLVNMLPEKAVKRFRKADPNRSPAEWGLRWLWNQPEITVVLSGMNSLDMVEENCRIASEVKAYELTDEDFQVYADVIAEINRKIKVGCTGCGYCMPCPRGVDIPGCFRAYNERYSEGFYTGMKEYFMCTTLRTRLSCASLCVQCGRCEEHCPQHIHIRDELKNVKRVMENPAYQVVKLGAHLLGRF
jgi:predicted aldo/keto reductase-like oxidoreductase